MTTQSEAALESGLIKTLVENSYERVIIKEEENLKANFKTQLEKHNLKQLQQFGRSQFTDKEFEKILIYLEGGTRFEKAKKLRDLYPLETEDGNRIWVEFLNQKKWCQNEFQVAVRVHLHFIGIVLADRAGGAHLQRFAELVFCQRMSGGTFGCGFRFSVLKLQFQSSGGIAVKPAVGGRCREDCVTIRGHPSAPPHL